MRIGVTSRIVQASGYHEPRDALAHDWADFLGAVMPGAQWMPIPNVGEARIVSFCEAWGIDGLILSGGEDIGTSPQRDETEACLLDWAEQNSLPVLGICRGMQFLARRAGVGLVPVDGHVASRHAIAGDCPSVVNSFHRLGLTSCPPDYRVTARAEDGAIEAIAHLRLRWEGWMWHPERTAVPAAMDIEGIRRVFA